MALSVYADASVIVALFTSDVFHDRAELFIETGRPTILVSDFAAAEFASALARLARTGEIAPAAARTAFSSFDGWSRFRGPRLETTTADVARGEQFLRRLDLNLRTPDAINIALAERHAAALATFDVRMADAARALGLEIAVV